MMNPDNFGIVKGRLTKDPIVRDNSDGSKKIQMTIAASDTYKNPADNKRTTQFVPLEAFIPKETVEKKGIGAYALIHQGDKVSVSYSVRNNNYVDKNTNQPVYGIVLQIDTIKLDESKTVTDARLASRMAKEQAAPAPASDSNMEPPTAAETSIPEGECETLE